MQSQSLKVKVVARREEARDICSYELADPHGLDLPPFSAGAHIDVEVQEALVRQYSLCNSSSERHRYLIAVLKEPAGRGGSLALHEQVAVGDIITISEPRNHFPLAGAGTRSLLLAGGIGVTPILSMAEELSLAGASFEVHYCARSPDRMAFAKRIAESRFADRVILHLDDGAEAQKLDVNSVLAHPRLDTHLYVCGPNGFMKWVLATAVEQGWTETQIHREYFSQSEPPLAAARQFEVQLARGNRRFVVPANKTIVQVLRENGIQIPTSCGEGVCGTCVTRVIAGEPKHADSVLSSDERARNDRMTPCCSRAKSELLVLDL
jgi:vanillate O-demethylase ferredoxin subunit